MIVAMFLQRRNPWKDGHVGNILAVPEPVKSKSPAVKAIETFYRDRVTSGENPSSAMKVFPCLMHHTRRSKVK
jgi:hypothetical protein